jgi:microcystin degradation protein MlrC
VEECLDWAAEAGTSPVIMADSGDNPTGGGVGDRADVLAALLRRGVQDALVAGIADAPATEACFQAGEGAALRLSIGATLDPAGSVPVIADAVVVTLDADERQAVVRIGGVRVVLCARRRPYHMIADFARLGLDPRAVRLLVVKSGYLSPELAPIARPSLLALSAGVVDQDVAHLPPGLRARPMFPFDADFMFEPVLRVSGRAL